jgi:hypothetical protein
LILAASASLASAQLPAEAASEAASAATSAPSHYYRSLAFGAATSIAAHELGHLAASLSTDSHPTFGFDKLRPTIYSGISLRDNPREQFWFSSAGLIVQSVMDESILDLPHHRGSAFERGLLGGGIGTTLFYLTIGRTGSVSDVDYIARTGVMSKTEITLLYGTIAALHTWRISRDSAYAHFFVAPAAHGFVVGVQR